MKIKWEMAGFLRSRPLMFYIALILAAFFAVPAIKVHAESVKIVIDPGHGGEDFGAQHNGLKEKDLNMAVAQAMAEELRKFEGIEVFLTRTDDRKLTLQQRADYAEEVGADFLFCLHFNMSERHTLYGTEVWISAFGDCYAQGKSFGELCLNELCTLGLYRRGVKTRLGKDGTDYYGIIKYAGEYGIPAAIIEHCHLDNIEDEGRYETAEALQNLGKLDAMAVAKYYGLYSPLLGIDYRKYGKPKVEVPSVVMKPDDTPPVNVSLTCLRTKAETGAVNVLLTGEDAESGLLYYDYSLDGGATYSGLQKWETDKKELECTFYVPVDQNIALKCRIYNGYDLGTETNTVEIPALQGWTEETAETVSQGEENGDVQEAPGAEETQFGTEEETVQASGSVYRIDMERYKTEDTGKEKIEIDSSAVSQFLWLVILGFLFSLSIFLTAALGVYRKKQKKAGRRGRGR